MANGIKGVVAFCARWIAKLFVIATICLIIQGIAGVYYAIRENKQTVITCKDFMVNRPANKWVKITDAEPVFSKMVTQIEFNKVREAYIPLIPTGSEPNTKTSILVSIQGDDCPPLQELADAGDDPIKQLQALGKIMSSPALQKPFEGMVRYGIDDSDKAKWDLHKKIPNLESDCVIIQKGEAPSMSKSLAKFGYAFICFILLMIFGFISETLKKAPPTISPSQSIPPPLPT